MERGRVTSLFQPPTTIHHRTVQKKRRKHFLLLLFLLSILSHFPPVLPSYFGGTWENSHCVAVKLPIFTRGSISSRFWAKIFLTWMQIYINSSNLRICLQGLRFPRPLKEGQRVALVCKGEGRRRNSKRRLRTHSHKFPPFLFEANKKGGLFFAVLLWGRVEEEEEEGRKGYNNLALHYCGSVQGWEKSLSVLHCFPL